MLALPPTFLCLPGPGDRRYAARLRKLRLRALRRLLLLTQAAHGELHQAMLDESRADPEGMLERVGAPTTLNLLLCQEAGLLPPMAALDGVVPALLRDLAPRRRRQGPLLWERPVNALEHGEQRWRFEPPARALGAIGGALEVDLGRGRRVELETLPAAPASLPLRGGVRLALVDDNPLAMQEAHPEKAGNALDLGGRTPETWATALDEALGLVEAALPEWWAELPISLRRVVPVGFLPEVHLSASYREAPGLAYLSLHPSALTLAEALVHEAQHSRLNVLLWTDAVLENGYTDWTSSPVRPDLRPLMGVLLAVHAFVPVAALHARLAAAGHPLARGPDVERRRHQVLSGNRRGLEILAARARPTPTGALLLAELGRLHGALEALADGPLHPELLPPG